MMRFARAVSWAVIGLLALAVPGQAQTPAGSDSSRYYVEVNGGATFGHKSSGSIGGEGGVHLTGPYSVFVEGGHMANVGTQALDDRALLIANAVGATASASYKVNYFDAGLRYLLPIQSTLHPYAVLGLGVASVKAETALAVNGTTVPPETLGVQFGADLDGSTSKFFLTLGGGITYPFAKRYFIDGSLRYGRIFPKKSVIEDDTGINTARLQVGAGVRF